MNKPNVVPWHRFTKQQAVDLVILTIMAEGLDPDGLLKDDGNPGQTSMDIAAAWDKGAVFPGYGPRSPDDPAINDWVSASDKVRAVLKVGRKIGHKGPTLVGLIVYLQGLPPEGPIGST